jgi:hypothetical protein
MVKMSMPVFKNPFYKRTGILASMMPDRKTDNNDLPGLNEMFPPTKKHPRILPAVAACLPNKNIQYHLHSCLSFIFACYVHQLLKTGT